MRQGLARARIRVSSGTLARSLYLIEQIWCFSIVLWMSGFFMDPSAGVSAGVHYCCIFNGERKLHSYNAGDGELESLADDCLDKAPSYHVWYFHTARGRTYGFFMEDGNTYFTIAESSMGYPAILRFLRHVRDGFNKSQKSGVQEELVPVIQRLVTTLGNVTGPTSTETKPPPEAPIPTDAPLLGKAVSKHDRKQTKDRVTTGARDVAEHHAVDLPPDTVAGVSTTPRRGLGRSRSQQVARRIWWRHVRIIVAVDVVLCLMLFGIWLVVCNGFRCISRYRG